MDGRGVLRDALVKERQEKMKEIRQGNVASTDNATPATQQESVTPNANSASSGLVGSRTQHATSDTEHFIIGDEIEEQVDTEDLDLEMVGIPIPEADAAFNKQVLAQRKEREEHLANLADVAQQEKELKESLAGFHTKANSTKLGLTKIVVAAIETNKTKPKRKPLETQVAEEESAAVAK